MKFEAFANMCSQSDVVATALTHVKLHGKIEWLNFSDAKWTLKLHSLRIQSTKGKNKKCFCANVENVKMVLLYDAGSDRCCDLLSNRFDIKTYYEPDITSDGLEGACVTGHENYFILSRDATEHNEIKGLGLGFYNAFRTRRKRNMINVTNLWLYLDSKNLYKIDTATGEFCY